MGSHGDQRQVMPIPSVRVSYYRDIEIDFLADTQHPPAKYLLPEVTVLDYGKKCVVIDLDETLVHSSFKVSQHKDHTYGGIHYFKEANDEKVWK
ncbi:hypothetical protein QTO34_007283 [Cnephaeus nilssonii]|uniref:FCP1 homology domain-containing protein n=1 Tax=Cnephaeus nilssonii TaxID=3371016 RepID=A0AA40HKX5_CNENI|nr:hypothetical protein QTO34_007283 [Eptesicus nilssonii]